MLFKKHFFRLTQKYIIEEFCYSNYLLLDRTHHFFMLRFQLTIWIFFFVPIVLNCSNEWQLLCLLLSTITASKFTKKYQKKSWNQLWPKKLIDFISWGNDATFKIALFSILEQCKPQIIIKIWQKRLHVYFKGFILCLNPRSYILWEKKVFEFFLKVSYQL